MPPCKPGLEANGSRLIASYTSHNKISFWGKFVGTLCCPFCCIGLVCYIPAFALKEVLSSLRNIIAYYSAPILHKLRPMIDREQKLFMDACLTVNAMSDGQSIVAELRLIDCIRNNNEMVNSIVKTPSMLTQRFITDKNKLGRSEYMNNVYEEYMKQGNPSVVIYGFPEYLAIIMDPTSDSMVQLYESVMNDTQLSRLVKTHKHIAGF
jgi:hypothetical protein